MSAMDSARPKRTVIPLSVPYSKKDYFKQKYGRQFLWNPEGKFWYWFSEAALPDDLQPFLPPSAPVQESIDSEIKLTLDPIPKTCWSSSVRKQMSKEQWETVRKHTFSNARYVCEICGGRGDSWPVECHEVYQYDEATRIQALLGFKALCPSCRLVKQFGRAQSQGREKEALAQLCKVNGWTVNHARKYVDEQFDLWEKRSLIKWTLDASYLERHFGISIKAESTDQRHDRAVAFYEKKLDEYRQRHPEEDLFAEMTTEHGLFANPPRSVPPILPPPIPNQSPSLLKRIFGSLFSKWKA